MIKGSGDGSGGQDPHVMEVASSLVSDVIERAREEVMKRKVIIPSTKNYVGLGTYYYLPYLPTSELYLLASELGLYR